MQQKFGNTRGQKIILSMSRELTAVLLSMKYKRKQHWIEIKDSSCRWNKFKYPFYAENQSLELEIFYQ